MHECIVKVRVSSKFYIDLRACLQSVQFVGHYHLTCQNWHLLFHLVAQRHLLFFPENIFMYRKHKLIIQNYFKIGQRHCICKRLL